MHKAKKIANFLHIIKSTSHSSAVALLANAANVIEKLLNIFYEKILRNARIEEHRALKKRKYANENCALKPATNAFSHTSIQLI